LTIDGMRVQRDNKTMSTFVWPTDDGWPYPDTPSEVIDLDGEADDDLLSLTSAPAHLLDHLSSLEREVVAARFGLAGHPERSMRELVAETGVPRSELRDALGSGLAKLRVQLQA
jgi:DNA-directed RNA polymerase specialized sigma24 family protein